VTVHDPGRYLVGGNPRSVVVPARVARAVGRLLYQHHAELCQAWSNADLEAGAVLAALDRAGVEWTQQKPSSPSGTWEVPPLAAPSDSLRDEIDTATVAHRLCCTPRNVRDLHLRGRLTGRKVGGRLLFAPEDVDVLVTDREDLK
jgi:hypothetical protein